MAKYRIVKLGGHDNAYRVQKKFWGFYWGDDTGMFFSLKGCEEYVQKQLQFTRKKDIVVREY
jgi:hypothetical protein